MTQERKLTVVMTAEKEGATTPRQRVTLEQWFGNDSNSDAAQQKVQTGIAGAVMGVLANAAESFNQNN
jgi:isochorismate hydrolase